MTLDEVFDALAERGAGLVVRDGILRFLAAQPLAPDDPLRAGIAEHRQVLIEMFAVAPRGRCVVEGCNRLPVSVNPNLCPDHCERVDAAEQYRSTDDTPRRATRSSDRPIRSGLPACHAGAARPGHRHVELPVLDCDDRLEDVP